MRIVNYEIVVPTGREAAYFADYGLRVHICGVGMAECAAATAQMLAERKPGLAILAGIAGSCVGDLKAGDAVVVASETVADLGRRESDGSFTPLFQKRYSATFIPDGFTAVHSNTVNMAGGLIAVSGRNADVGHAGKSPLPECNGVSLENMEGAAFFAICERFKVPAMELRTISNRVGEPVTPDNLELAARNLAAAVKKLLA